MLKHLLETLEGLDEALHTHYKKNADGKFILEVSGGAKPEEVARLTESLSKERTDHKETKTKLTAWGDLDPTEAIPKLDKVEELQAQIDAGEGKEIDTEAQEKLTTARVNRQLAPVQRELDQTKSKLEEVTGERDRLTGELSTGTIERAVMDAATAAGLVPSAIDDAKLFGARVLEIVDGKVVTKDGVGVTPGTSIADLLEDVKSTRGHWWPASEGGGAGDHGGEGGANNPFSKEHWNMTAQGALITDKGSEVAAKMAAAVGSAIGNTTPPEK